MNQNRIESLKNKHRALDQEIQTLQRSPGVDSLNLRQLKKEKLELKLQLESALRESQ